MGRCGKNTKTAVKPRKSTRCAVKAVPKSAAARSSSAKIVVFRAEETVKALKATAYDEMVQRTKRLKALYDDDRENFRIDDEIALRQAHEQRTLEYLSRRFDRKDDEPVFPFKYGTCVLSRTKSEKKSFGLEHVEYSTNGRGVHYSGVTSKYVETATMKKEFNENDYLCNRPIQKLAEMWGKREKKHFFLDGMHAVTVIREEFGYPLDVYVGCRWFTVMKTNVGPRFFRVEYRRTLVCLEKHLEENGGGCVASAYCSFSAIVDKVFKIQELANGGKGLYQMEFKRWLTALPSPENFKAKINMLTEYIHLAYIVIETVYGVLSKGEMRSEEVFEMIKSIFSGCRDKRSMASILYDFACVYDSISAILQCGYVEGDRIDPETIPDKMRARNQREYTAVLAIIEEEIRTFVYEIPKKKKRITMGEARRRSWLITRWRICQNFGLFKKHGQKDDDFSVGSNAFRFEESDDGISENYGVSDDGSESEVEKMSSNAVAKNKGLGQCAAVGKKNRKRGGYAKGRREITKKPGQARGTNRNEGNRVGGDGGTALKEAGSDGSYAESNLEENDEEHEEEEEGPGKMLEDDRDDELKYENDHEETKEDGVSEKKIGKSGSGGVFHEEMSEDTVVGVAQANAIEQNDAEDMTFMIEMGTSVGSDRTNKYNSVGECGESGMVVAGENGGKKNDCSNTCCMCSMWCESRMFLQDTMMWEQPVAEQNSESTLLPWKKPDAKLMRDKVSCEIDIMSQWGYTAESMNARYDNCSGMGVHRADKSIPHDEYYSDLSRFDHLHWARLEDCHKYNPTLYVKGTLSNIIFRCCPAELYVALDLKDSYHWFYTNGGVFEHMQGNTFQSMRHVESVDIPKFSAVRLNSVHFSKYFNNVKVNFSRIMRFVISTKQALDAKRDGGTNAKNNGCRLDFGVGGLAFEARKKGKKGFPRAIICGNKHFKDYPEEEAIRRDIGVLADAATLIMDNMQQNHTHLPVNMFKNKKRFQKYGKLVRDFLKAKVVQAEWITLQIKCLDRGDITHSHLDEQNCSWVGYNATGTLSFIFMDRKGVFWSLKIILNSRKVIGDHLIPGFSKLYSSMKRQLMAIDKDYESLMNLRYKGRWPDFDRPLTALNFRAFFLDDDMPWKRMNINATLKEVNCTDTSTREKVVVEMFSVTAAPQRDLCLSMLVDSVRVCTTKWNLTIQDQLKMVILTTYQNSFVRTYHVAKTYEPQSAKQYYDLMVDKFGSFTGGPGVRYSASGFNPEAVYFDGDEGDKRFDAVVEEILKLITWINCHSLEKDEADKKRKRITLEEYEDQVDSTVSNIHSRLPKNMKAQISHFRLLLILQICALSGVGLEEHLFLTKLVYVAQGTGGWNFLHRRVNKDGKGSEYGLETETIMDVLADALGIPEKDRGSAMDVLGCESQVKRRDGNVRDLFVKGQSLYTLTQNGCRVRKQYGELHWIMISGTFSK